MPLFGLVVVAMLILFGSAVFLVFDPLSLFTRSATTLVYPAVDRALQLGGRPPLPQYRNCRAASTASPTSSPAAWCSTNGLLYKLQLVILAMFVVVLAISYIERRMWCRHLCPLGALLG